MNNYAKSQVTEKIKTAKGREKLCSSENYKYKFPISTRYLNVEKGFSVDEAGKYLLDFFWRIRSCIRIIAGALIRIEHFELKIELSHFLYQFSELALKIRIRLEELRISNKKIENSKPYYLDIVENEILILDDSIDFTLSLYNVMISKLILDMQNYCGSTHNLLDQPSIRILEISLIDLFKMKHWFLEVEKAVINAGDDINKFIKSSKRISDIFNKISLGQVCSHTQELYKRPHECKRDPRFSTYHHTRQNNITDIKAKNIDFSDFDAEKLELFWVQRDELDAIETFANIIYDLKPEFELECFLARLVWDEARHSEMGQQNMKHLGFDPFDIPCGVIGINVRSPLSSIIAFAQISIFGELNQIGYLKKLSDKCYDSNDYIAGNSFDFTHADELMHIRKGREWLKILSSELDTDINGLELLAKEESIKRLIEEGILNEEYANKVTSSDLGKLIGE